MAPKKVIAVVGATGAQGGGLVRAILNDKTGEFAARAITRDVSSPKAQELARLGAEVVGANVDDAESLKRAFAGAYGAFCVTFFWEHFSRREGDRRGREHGGGGEGRGRPARHLVHARGHAAVDPAQRRPDADAARASTRCRTSTGRARPTRSSSTWASPSTLLNTSFYWDNFIYFGAGPKPGPDGVLALTLPMGDKRLPGIAAEDIGKCALGIFKAGRSSSARRVGIAGEHLTGAQLAAKLTRALGREVRYNDVPPDGLPELRVPRAPTTWATCSSSSATSTRTSSARAASRSTRRLNPELQDFDAWLAANASKIPLE